MTNAQSPETTSTPTFKDYPEGTDLAWDTDEGLLVMALVDAENLHKAGDMQNCYKALEFVRSFSARLAPDMVEWCQKLARQLVKESNEEIDRFVKLCETDIKAAEKEIEELDEQARARMQLRGGVEEAEVEIAPISGRVGKALMGSLLKPLDVLDADAHRKFKNL